MDEKAKELAARWGFVPTEELPAGYCSRVYADAKRVLKAPWRGEEMDSGYRAALALSGWWGPEVFEGDPDSGAVLMARINPGTTLADAKLPDTEGMDLVISLTKEIAGISPEGYPSVKEWFGTYSSPLLEHLYATTSEPVFLHGDLHHFNLLRSDTGPRTWVPIDPKGLSGDLAFEAIAYLRNLTELFEGDELQQLIESRLDYLSKGMGVDPWRVAAWCLSDQLACIADGDDTPEGQRLKLALEKLV